MTPEQKAKELVEKFRIHSKGDFHSMNISSAKNCALICVSEMLAITPMYTGNLNPKWDYYDKVKKELELL